MIRDVEYPLALSSSWLKSAPVGKHVKAELSAARNNLAKGTGTRCFKMHVFYFHMLNMLDAWALMLHRFIGVVVCCFFMSVCLDNLLDQARATALAFGAMSDGADVETLRAAKRMRMMPELAGRAFQFQNMTQNRWGQLWPPISLVLTIDGKVLLEGHAPHGEWKPTPDCLLSLRFNHQGDESKCQQMYFDKIPQADAWATVRCTPEWAAVLVPMIQQGILVDIKGIVSLGLITGSRSV